MWFCQLSGQAFAGPPLSRLRSPEVRGSSEVRCPECRSPAVKERPERTAQGYCRFRCLDCTKQFNERNGGGLNRTQYPTDVIALAVLWRLSLRDLAEMFLIRGFIFTYEAVREWEAKLTPTLAENLRRKRQGPVGRSWYTDLHQSAGPMAVPVSRDRSRRRPGRRHAERAPRVGGRQGILSIGQDGDRRHAGTGHDRRP